MSLKFWRSWPWRQSRRRPTDFSREIQSHLAHETEQLVAEGMSPDQAPRAAHKRFGNVTLAEERFFESSRVLWLDHVLQDVRYAVRGMAKHPIACVVAVLSLAGGIGMTTVTLTIGNAVFRRPPPLYQHPEQLSRVSVGTPERPFGPVPGALYAIWNQDADLRATIAASTDGRPADVRTGDRLDTVRVHAVTPGLFSILGVGAALGRTFSDAPASGLSIQGPKPAVLSYRVWQNLFGGRADVLGQVVRLDDEAFAVIGVMPERFWFAAKDGPIWTPLDLNALAPDQSLEMVVRRPPQLSAAGLTDRLQQGAAEYVNHFPETERRLRVLVSGIGGTPMARQMALVVPWLVGTAVLLTLLIACANVAILMFARWTTREHEMAIRASLGASRSRIVRLMLTESVLIASVGGALGVCATFALRGLILRGGSEAATFDSSIDGVILIQSAFAALVAGILSGIAPALYETSRLQSNPLRVMAASDRVRQRWRHVLVVFEISVTVALLVVATTMIDASRRMLRTDLGFRTAPLLTARVERVEGVETAKIVDILNGLPGVARAAAASAVPPSWPPTERIAADQAGSSGVVAGRSRVDPAFFATIDVPLRAGRTFTEQDRSATSRVAIVNEPLALSLWPDRDPIGATVWVDHTAYEIVGVVSPYTSYPLGRPLPNVYLPLPPQARDATHVEFLIRATGNPSTLVDTVRREIKGVGGNHVVSAAFTIDQLINIGSQEVLVLAYAMAPLIATGLFLTAAGVFGVLAFAIARRSKELALRVSIGATSRHLVGLVVSQTARLFAVGAVLGVGVTFALTRVVRAGGGGGSAFDTPGWPAFVVPVLVVVVIGGLATWVPTRRALTIDPALLLRTD